MRKSKSRNDDACADDPFRNEFGRRNKSALKRQQVALQELVDAAAGMPLSRFRKVPLSERIRDELALLRTMKPGGARQRQIRLIVKRLEADDVAALQQTLDSLHRISAADVALQHRAERLREQLLETHEGGIEVLLAEVEIDDLPALTTMIREAKAEIPGPNAKHAFREIYRTLYASLEAQQLNPESDPD